MTANIFLISDTHFGHENMYKFTGLDGLRVRAKFANASEGDEYMIQAWNQTVKPQDHVYHLGDVAFGPISIVQKLNGHKRLVLGNHDFEKMHGYHAVDPCIPNRSVARCWATYTDTFMNARHLQGSTSMSV
jgi:calcineurin-like phosphoesterase family protein